MIFLIPPFHLHLLSWILLFILLPKLSQFWPVESLEQAAYYVLLTCSQRFLSTSLLSGTTCSKLSLYFLCPSIKICHFSREPWFLLLMIIQMCHGFKALTTDWVKEYTHIHTNTYLYLCLFLYSINMFKTTSAYWSCQFQSNSTEVQSFPFPYL